MHSYPISLKMSAEADNSTLPTPSRQCDRCHNDNDGNVDDDLPASRYYSSATSSENGGAAKGNVNRSVVIGGTDVTGTQWFAQGRTTTTTKYLPSGRGDNNNVRYNQAYLPTRGADGTYSRTAHSVQCVETKSSSSRSGSDSTNSSQYFSHVDNNNSSPKPQHRPTQGEQQCRMVAQSSSVSVQSSTTYHTAGKHCNRPCSLNMLVAHPRSATSFQTPSTPATPSDHYTSRLNTPNSPCLQNNLNYPLSKMDGVGHHDYEVNIHNTQTKTTSRSALDVEPLPHFSSLKYWGGGGGTLSVLPSQQPRSYTSVNLTLRPPSLDPLPPIEIASAGTSLTYSTSSYDPRQGFQSQLQIRIGPGGVGSVSALRTRAPPELARPRSCYVPALESREERLLRAESMPDVAALSLLSEEGGTTTSTEESLRSQMTALGGDQLHAITQSLLAAQIERKNRLRNELKREKQKLRDMQREVHNMAEDLESRRRRQRTANIALPVVTTVLQKVQCLRQEIQFLQTECKKMTTEVDMSSDDRVPLGETDEAFYKNIYTGQRGCVLNMHPPSNTPRQENRSQPSQNSPLEALDLDGPNWTCSECTFRNHPLLDKCEQCEMPRIILGTDSRVTALPANCFCHPLDMIDKACLPNPLIPLPRMITNSQSNNMRQAHN